MQVIYELISESYLIISNPMESQPQKQQRSRRTAGRPRRLTLDAIVEAACRLAPAELDMASVARSLDVGVATLYGYVEGREQLLHLVAQRKSQLERIADRGQPWQEVVREHAGKTFQAMVEWPEMITQIINGGVFGSIETDYLEHLLELLCARGFSPAEALDMYYTVNQLVLGAAVTSSYLQAAETQAGRHGSPLWRFVLAQPLDELPLLREALTMNPMPAVLADYSGALERFITAREQ